MGTRRYAASATATHTRRNAYQGYMWHLDYMYVHMCMFSAKDMGWRGLMAQSLQPDP